MADDAFAEADAEVIALLKDALARMGEVLPRPTGARIVPEGLDPWREAFRIIQGREIWESYGGFVEQRKPKLGPGIEQRMAFAATVTESAAEAARTTQIAARDQMRALLKPGVVLALPTVPCIAPLADTPAKELESFRLRVMRLTCIAGITGLPQITMPVGLASGCPVGLSFIGWAGGDEALLDLTVSLSRYCGACRV